jgi:phospholipase C
VGAAILAGCGGGSASAPAPPAQAHPSPAPTPQTPRGHLRHVVVIVQENRSFDNLFHAFPGADTVDIGQSSQGPIPLRPMSLAAPYEIGHEHPGALLAVDGGKMDGFLEESVVPHVGTTAPPNAEYVYVPRREVTAYWRMARAGVLADRFFSQLDGSYIAHQYLIAGQAGHAINVPSGYPWGCEASSLDLLPIVDDHGTIVDRVRPCFGYRTLGDRLSEARVPWRYYAPPYGQRAFIWSAFDAIRDIHDSKDWATHVIAPETEILTDLAAGKPLAGVTWVVPNGLNSDHPNSQSTAGPAWVSSVVDAIGQSRNWNDCAIVILWDDWGGLYDHVPPPTYDQFGPGIRVPLIVLSPYALRGSVAHSTYTFGSVMRLIEDTFALRSLGTIDAHAASFASDVFDFGQAPRPYPGPFGSPADRARVLNEPVTSEPPDEG